MQPVRHIAALENAIARVRRSAETLSTNLFAGREQLEAWRSQRGLCFAANDTSVLVLRPDRDFCRIYHVSASVESLASQLKELTATRGTFVSDLVGLPQSVKAAAETYARYGFEQYHSLFRMRAAATSLATPCAADPAVQFATAEDVPRISAFLESLLDPYVDQIPGESDLRSAVARQNVLVTRNAGQVSAALVFERTGITAFLRYWYVAPESRGHGEGARLIKTFFRLCHDARRFLLWVVSENEDTIAKYLHYGFRKEDLLDQIMLRRAA